jgi:hypothetical protein
MRLASKMKLLLQFLNAFVKRLSRPIHFEQLLILLSQFLVSGGAGEVPRLPGGADRVLKAPGFGVGGGKCAKE